MKLALVFVLGCVAGAAILMASLVIEEETRQ